MNEQPGPSTPHRDRPSSHAQAGEPEGQSAYAQLKSSQALERLRERIQSAAHEILRLREENTALAQRIAQLESDAPAAGEGQAGIRLEEDPEVLRRKITSFIEAIDQYLKRDQP